LAFPLALLALWRARQEKKGNRRWNWILFLVAAALYTAAITIGLCGALMPEVPSNLAGFKSSTTVMFKHPGWTLAWTMIWAGLTLAAAFLEIFWRAISSKAGIYILFGMFGVWATWPLLAPDRLDNGLQCDYRILDVLVPMALLPAALILRFRPQWFERRQKRVTQLAAALLMTQSLWQISATINWYRDVIWMREILATKHGIVSLRSTALAVDGMEGRELYRDAMGGRFDWVWPCLSIALSPKPKINCLIYSEVFMNAETPRKYWQPFDPLEPKTLPHLEHYGVDYSNYVAALSNKSKPSP
jgi:hypothetical protein